MNDEHCVVERTVRPVRHVEVCAAGAWWPGVQHGWRMYDDATGWRAAVRFVTADADGLVAREADVILEAVRPRGAAAAVA